MSTVETLSTDLVKIITEYIKENKIYLCQLRNRLTYDTYSYYSEYFKSEDKAIEYGIQKWKELVHGEKLNFVELYSERMEPRISRYENSISIKFWKPNEYHDFFVEIKIITIKD